MDFIRAWEEYMVDLWRKCEKQCEKYQNNPEKFRKCIEKCEEKAFRGVRA